MILRRRIQSDFFPSHNFVVSLRTPRNARKSSELEDGFQPSWRHAPGPREQYTFAIQLQRSTRARLAQAQSRHLNRATFQPSAFDVPASSFLPFLSLCPSRNNNSPSQHPLCGYESECKSTASQPVEPQPTIASGNRLPCNQRKEVTGQRFNARAGKKVPRGKLYRRRCLPSVKG